MDPLDWLHQWDDYEMYMYADPSGDGVEPGIYMQVSRRVMHQGAEEWSLLYERRLADLPADIDASGEAWEDAVLRAYLKQNPDLVQSEKAHLQAWLTTQQQS